MSVTNFRRASLANGLPKSSEFADIPYVPPPPPGIITSGLVRYYNAGNTSSYPGTGTTWTDLQGSGYNLTLNNGPTFTSNGAGSYFTFDGSNDEAAGNDAGLPNGGNDRTICIWVYRLSVDDFRSIYSYGTQNFNQAISVYYVSGYSPNTYSWLVDKYGGAAGTAGQWNSGLNEWTLLGFTLSGTSYGIYYNDTRLGTGTFSGVSTTLSGTSPGLKIAAIPGVGNGNIRVGQWFIYNTALSQSDMLSNYNATKAAYGL
jgi:hypothetical protein